MPDIKNNVIPRMWGEIETLAIRSQSKASHRELI